MPHELLAQGQGIRIFIEQNSPPRKQQDNTLMGFQTAAIVGLPNVGKSTLFNALDRDPPRRRQRNYPFCTIEAERSDASACLTRG